MTLHVNQRGDRIVCRWTEPVKFKMDKKEGILDKVRTLALNVDPRGRLTTRDKKRHGGKPIFSHAQRFRDRLEEMNFFASRIVCACSQCGQTEEVLPHYDPERGAISWRCSDPVRCQIGNK